MGKFIITEDERKRILNLYSLTEATEHTQNLYKSWANNKSGNPELALSLMDDFFNLQKRLSKKDFTQYKSAEELKNDIDNIKTADQQKKTESDVDIIHKDNNLLVVATKTWEAGCKYGSGTKWCTSSKDTPSYWQRHNSTGTEFIWILKNIPAENPQHKVSLHFNDGGIHDWCNSVNRCSPNNPYSKNKIVIPNFNEVFKKCEEYSKLRTDARKGEKAIKEKEFLKKYNNFFHKIKSVAKEIYNDEHFKYDIFQYILDEIYDNQDSFYEDVPRIEHDGVFDMYDKMKKYYFNLSKDVQLEESIIQIFLDYLINFYLGKYVENSTNVDDLMNSYISDEKKLKIVIINELMEITKENLEVPMADEWARIVKTDPEMKEYIISDDEYDEYYEYEDN